MAENDSNSSLWRTGLGMLFTLVVLVWVLPTDKIYKKVIQPGWDLLKTRAGNGLDAVHASALDGMSWSQRKLRFLFMLTMMMFGLSVLILLPGLDDGNRGLVVLSGLIFAFSGVMFWVVMKTVTKLLAFLVNTSSGLIGSSARALLKKAGLSEGEGENFRIRSEYIDEIFSKGFVLLPGIVEAYVLLFAMPSFTMLLAVSGLALVAVASGLVAAHIHQTLAEGWKVTMRVNYVLAVLIAFVGAWAHFLPKSFAKYSDAGALDTWLVGLPSTSWSFGFWGTIIGIAAIGAFAWVLTGLIKGEVGRRLTTAVVLATVVAMGIGGYRAWGSESSKTTASSTVHAPVYDSGNASTPPSGAGSGYVPVAPNNSGANTMTMPDVDYKSPNHKPSSKRVAVKQVKESSKAPASSTPAVPTDGDGYDRAEALLSQAGL